MNQIRKYQSTEVDSSITTQSLEKLAAKTGNLYKSLFIMAKRAGQVQGELREELHAKLDEFASGTDNLEEVFENREQIEISKFYEKLPHHTLLSTDELLDDKIFYKQKEVK